MHIPEQMVTPKDVPQARRSRRVRWGKLGLGLLGLLIFALLIRIGGVETLHFTQLNVPLLLVVGLVIAVMLLVVSLRLRLLTNSLAGRQVASPMQFYFLVASSLALVQIQGAKVE